MVFEDVEAFVHDFPAGARGCGDGFGIGFGEFEAGDEGAFIDRLALGRAAARPSRAISTKAVHRPLAHR